MYIYAHAQYLHTHIYNVCVYTMYVHMHIYIFIYLFIYLYIYIGTYIWHRSHIQDFPINAILWLGHAWYLHLHAAQILTPWAPCRDWPPWQCEGLQWCPPVPKSPAGWDGWGGICSCAILCTLPFLGQKMNENPPSMEPNKWEHGTLGDFAGHVGSDRTLFWVFWVKN